MFCRKLLPRSDGRGYAIDRLALAPIINTPEHYVAPRTAKSDITIVVLGNEVTGPIEDGATAFCYDPDSMPVLHLGADLHDYMAIRHGQPAMIHGMHGRTAAAFRNGKSRLLPLCFSAFCCSIDFQIPHNSWD